MTNILTFIIFILVNLSAILSKDNLDNKEDNKSLKNKKKEDSIGLFKKDYSYIGLISSIIMLCHSF